MSLSRSCETFAHVRAIATRRAELLCVVCVVAALALLATTPVCAQVSTRDGGWAWQNPLPQGNGLNAVVCANATHAWAVGDCGTILATANGGSHWSVQD